MAVRAWPVGASAALIWERLRAGSEPHPHCFLEDGHCGRVQLGPARGDGLAFGFLDGKDGDLVGELAARGGAGQGHDCSGGVLPLGDGGHFEQAQGVAFGQPGGLGGEGRGLPGGAHVGLVPADGPADRGSRHFQVEQHGDGVGFLGRGEAVADQAGNGHRPGAGQVGTDQTINGTRTPTSATEAASSLMPRPGSRRLSS